MQLTKVNEIMAIILFTSVNSSFQVILESHNIGQPVLASTPS